MCHLVHPAASITSRSAWQLGSGPMPHAGFAQFCISGASQGGGGWGALCSRHSSGQGGAKCTQMRGGIGVLGPPKTNRPRGDAGWFPVPEHGGAS